eukprot:g36895.t1
MQDAADVEDLGSAFQPSQTRKRKLPKQIYRPPEKKMWVELKEEEKTQLLKLLEELSSRGYDSRPEFQDILGKMKIRYRLCIKNSQIAHYYRRFVQEKLLVPHSQLSDLFRTKAMKSASGILSVTIFTSPHPAWQDEKGEWHSQRFTCQWNCYYCPNHPDFPRSYLPEEPGCRRAKRCGFDAVDQMESRLHTLRATGHPLDKLEVLVLGGTWESYPVAYQEQFCRDIFYAANTFQTEADLNSEVEPGTVKEKKEARQRLSLEEEQKINETAHIKVIGLTLETRPDTVTSTSIRRMRRLGCTRVQIGIQHIDQAILDWINRQHTADDAVTALRLLKDTCFKIDIHLMPDLPGSDPEKDKEMFGKFLGVEGRQTTGLTERWKLTHPELQADQWKIYPCAVTPWTVIEKWYKEGSYEPYGDNTEILAEVLTWIKLRVFPWIRLNRVIRDIPSTHIVGGNSNGHLRAIVLKAMAKEGKACACIRCREVGLNSPLEDAGSAQLFTRVYAANQGTEYFLSFETPDNRIIFGFLRLRISPTAGADVFPSLANAGLVRELHVYGQMLPTYIPATASNKKGEKVKQHGGFGKKLMAEAERLSWLHGCQAVAVISGVGTREYYRKLGYKLTRQEEGAFL